MVYLVKTYAFPKGEGLFPGYFANKLAVATIAAAVLIVIVSAWVVLTQNIFSAEKPFKLIKIVIVGYLIVIGIGLLIALTNPFAG